MFSVEYFGGIVLISCFKIRKINFFNGEKLRKLILQSMKQVCTKIVVNVDGVSVIDAGVIENIKLLQEITTNLGIELSLVNVDSSLKKRIAITDYNKDLRICCIEEVVELASIKK